MKYWLRVLSLLCLEQRGDIPSTTFTTRPPYAVCTINTSQSTVSQVCTMFQLKRKYSEWLAISIALSDLLSVFSGTSLSPTNNPLLAKAWLVENYEKISLYGTSRWLFQKFILKPAISGNWLSSSAFSVVRQFHKLARRSWGMTVKVRSGEEQNTRCYVKKRWHKSLVSSCTLRVWKIAVHS